MDKFPDVDLTTSVGRVKLKNPILVAAGTFGYGEEYSRYIDLNILGGIITKTITLNPREGNPPPRLAETPCGLLNSIGLENPGVDAFISQKLPFLKELTTAVIVSIAGEKEEEYLRLAERLSKEEGIRALEVNVSCPNVKLGGVALGKDSGTVFSLARRLKEAIDMPFILKLPPFVDIVEVAQAAREGGAEALSLINTVPAMAIDVERRRPKLGNITGGLSGPCIKPVAVKIVWEVTRKVDIPVIGMGGIMDFEDVLEFTLAGASAVAVGTANFTDPGVSVRIIKDLKNYLGAKNITKFSELVGRISLGE
ncbi:dihydroorotate dehydrogenase [Candidatus Aerophobetes bacterium]|nr:dihydroorotate dehydrogenase [Candidatus Aerophobetes bacterium]